MLQVDAFGYVTQCLSGPESAALFDLGVHSVQGVHMRDLLDVLRPPGACCRQVHGKHNGTSRQLGSGVDTPSSIAGMPHDGDLDEQAQRKADEVRRALQSYACRLQRSLPSKSQSALSCMMSQVFFEMVGEAMRTPGTSWRVGVLPNCAAATYNHLLGAAALHTTQPAVSRAPVLYSLPQLPPGLVSGCHPESPRVARAPAGDAPDG